MEIPLAPGVSELFSRRGSPVFTCSIDAHGAFDHIPHSVIFAKLDGVLPDGPPQWLTRYATESGTWSKTEFDHLTMDL